MPKKIWCVPEKFREYVITGNLEAVKYWVSQQKVKLNWTDVCGYCYLTNAVRCSQILIAKYLLENGISVDGSRDCSEDWFTTLHWAVQINDLAMVDLLLKHGASKDKKDLWGETAFSLAENFGYDKVLKLLKK